MRAPHGMQPLCYQGLNIFGGEDGSTVLNKLGPNSPASWQLLTLINAACTGVLAGLTRGWHY